MFVLRFFALMRFMAVGEQSIDALKAQALAAPAAQAGAAVAAGGDGAQKSRKERAATREHSDDGARERRAARAHKTAGARSPHQIGQPRTQ